MGPKLVPFFKTTAVYFVLFFDDRCPSMLAMVVKCLPIISLIVFVLLHGMNLSDEYAYSRRILTGLIFACVGDALLVWDSYFLHGMFMFGVAQALYASAFGMRPFNPYVGSVTAFLGAIVLYNLCPILDGVMSIAVPIYVILIAFMTWRSIARVQFFDDLWTWTKLCSCGGAVLFCISDTAIAVNRFLLPLPGEQLVIMVTYYAAQLGIALSVVDSRATAEPRSKNPSVEQVMKQIISSGSLSGTSSNHVVNGGMCPMDALVAHHENLHHRNSTKKKMNR